MPKFKYRAINNAGETQPGIIEANDGKAAEEQLRERGFYPLDVQLLIEKESKRDIELSYKIKTSDLSIFCNQFSVVLKAGIPVLQSLELMSNQTENNKLKQVLDDVYDRIQKGASVSEAFRNHERRFPEIFISMLEAGETSGELDLVLERMSISLEKEHKLSQKIKSAMIYPVILSVVALGVLVFLLVAVVPTFSGMYASAGQELPKLTQAMLGLGDFMSKYFILLFLITIMIVFLIRIALRMEEVRYSFDRLKIKIPVMGPLLLKIITARYTQSMSTLLSSGIPLIQAIDITSRSLGNAYVSEGVKSLATEVRMGNGLSIPLEKLNIFAPMVVQMTRIGEASGTLDDLLAKTSQFYENEADSATTKLTALIEPVIIVVMGGLVLLIILSILLPMFGMFSLVQ